MAVSKGEIHTLYIEKEGRGRGRERKKREAGIERSKDHPCTLTIIKHVYTLQAVCSLGSCGSHVYHIQCTCTCIYTYLPSIVLGYLVNSLGLTEKVCLSTKRTTSSPQLPASC